VVCRVEEAVGEPRGNSNGEEEGLDSSFGSDNTLEREGWGNSDA
jgi:hypothetical protein